MLSRVIRSAPRVLVPSFSALPRGPLSISSTRPVASSLRSAVPARAMAHSHSHSHSHRAPPKKLTHDNMNEQVRNSEYAVRGELVIRATKHQEAIEKGDKSLPFNELIYCNIGNPQQLKQKPITFFRQVISLCENPDLLESKYVNEMFPADVVSRARALLSSISGGTGAYSGSQGVPAIVQNVAKYIKERDGHDADPSNIFLTDGASVGVQRILRLLIRDEKDGIMIPIPQYPLYSATIALYGGSQVGYYLDEGNDWAMNVKELDRALKAARLRGVECRALAVINPGNPTGQVMERKNMEDVIKFCHDNHLLLLADEVYQENVYVKESKPFVSFKKVLMESPEEYRHLELASFHSVSKGVVGECGKRGGYMELVNYDEKVKQEVYKLASIGLCPNVIGQIVVDLMVNPPKKGDPSYELYKKETEGIYESLKRRALVLVENLNKMEGVQCNPAEGAMYAFPQITLSPKAVAAAKEANKAPDVFYSIAMLDATGVCVVPGSGFGQRDGTYHFRTTFLPPEDKMESVIKRVAKFHAEFMNKYK